MGPDSGGSPPAPTSRRAGLAGLLLAALAVSGCGGSGAAKPVATITMPDIQSSTPPTLPATTVTLKPGQTFLFVAADQGSDSWRAATDGDPRVVRQTASQSVPGSCPPGNVGCFDPEQRTYTAEGVGSTTVVWQLAEAGVSFCPTLRAHGLPCYVATKTIRVVVSG